MKRTITVLTLGAALVAASADADPIHIDAVVTTQPENQAASFGIYFNAPPPPDFVTTDSVGRLATSFQFYVAEQLFTSIFASQYLIRKVDDSFPGYVNIVKRDSSGGNNGWGSLTGTAPFVQDGRFVGFAVPLTLLATDDNFYWMLDTFTFGGTPSYHADGYAEPGPVPTAAPDATSTAGLLTVGLLAVAAIRHRVMR